MIVDTDVFAAPSASGAARFILGGPYGREPAEQSYTRLDAFADVGGRLVETAYSYSGGRSKVVVGNWLRSNPGQLGVVTKVGHDPSGNDGPLHRERVLGQLEESLDALGVEQLAVLMYHCDDSTIPVPELAATLQEVHESGLAVRVGASNWSAPRLRELFEELAPTGTPLVASYHLSLADPDPVLLRPAGLWADPGIRAALQDHDVPLISWSAQAKGYFAKTGASVPPTPFDSPANAARRERVQRLAAERGTSPAAIALAWSLAEPGLWPTIGPSSLAQLQDSLLADTVELTPEDQRWLTSGDEIRGAQPLFFGT